MSRRNTGLTLLQTERDLFEIDHCAAGAFRAAEWNFPEPIVSAIARHHEEPEKSAELLHLVQIGWRLAGVVGFGAFPMDKTWSYEGLVALIPSQAASWPTAGADVVEDEITSRLSNLRR